VDAPSTTTGRQRLTGRLPLSVRKLPFRAADSAVAWYEASKFKRDLPTVAAALDGVGEDHELRVVYDRYVADISSWDWAVAWRTALALGALCNTLRPRRILDLGSGFSTYVECRWAQQAQTETQIVSVDDSPDWLETTRGFLAGQSLSCELVGRAELGSLPDSTFDLAFDDIGRIEQRADAIDTLVRVMAPGGIVVLDDMNVRGYRADVRARLKRAGWPLYSLRRQTIDQRGRFAMLTAAPRR
jgi:predicted O-methyltransferase YrrM